MEGRGLLLHRHELTLGLHLGLDVVRHGLGVHRRGLAGVLPSGPLGEGDRGGR